MLRALRVIPAADLDMPCADDVMLDWDGRRRRRQILATRRGATVLLDLAQAPTLADGDGLVLEDGRVLRVAAAPERLQEIVCGDPLHLARIAWHLGNRHLETELRPGALRIREDHVIADMARRLGADVHAIQAAFQPERGAYDGHGHGHGHDHDHDHDHG